MGCWRVCNNNKARKGEKGIVGSERQKRERGKPTATPVTLFFFCLSFLFPFLSFTPLFLLSHLSSHSSPPLSSSFVSCLSRLPRPSRAPPAAGSARSPPPASASSTLLLSPGLHRTTTHSMARYLPPPIVPRSCHPTFLQRMTTSDNADQLLLCLCS